VLILILKSEGVSIQMQAIELYVPVVPFLIQSKMVLTFDCANESVTGQLNAPKQHFDVVLFGIFPLVNILEQFSNLIF